VALHSYSLMIRHPESKKKVNSDSTLPSILKSSICDNSTTPFLCADVFCRSTSTLLGKQVHRSVVISVRTGNGACHYAMKWRVRIEEAAHCAIMSTYAAVE
jgi:hypothetical protein